MSSPQTPIVYGAPQGSVLGPIFFILCTNPLKHLIHSADIKSEGNANDCIILKFSSPDWKHVHKNEVVDFIDTVSS